MTGLGSIVVGGQVTMMVQPKVIGARRYVFPRLALTHIGSITPLLDLVNDRSYLRHSSASLRTSKAISVDFPRLSFSLTTCTIKSTFRLQPTLASKSQFALRPLNEFRGGIDLQARPWVLTILISTWPCAGDDDH